MSMDFSKIITAEDLKDFEKVKSKITDNGEVYVFEHNRPAYVVMSVEQYDLMFEKMKHNYGASPDSNENLETLINKVGKKIFVEYYYVFKDDANPEEALKKEKLTLASRRSRSSTARKIFKEGMQIAALNNIISSARIGTTTINRAKEIIEKESSTAFEELSSEKSDKYSVKIGKMARGIFSTLIFNEEIKTDELSGFMDGFYCKNIFGLNYPLLKRLGKGEAVDTGKRDSNGYNRYYETVIDINSERYLICSQWVENIHRDMLNQWIISKMTLITGKKARLMSHGIDFSIKTLLGDYWEYLPFDLRKAIDKRFKLNISDNASIIETGIEDGMIIYRKV